MVKQTAIAAILLASIPLTAQGSAACAEPITQQMQETLANSAIERARFLISVERLDEAYDVLSDILMEKGLSDEIIGRALSQRGNIALRRRDYAGAMREYKSVLDLPRASASLKKAAQFGFEMASGLDKVRQK